MDDAGLMARIADGDAQAFDRLVERHASRSLALAERLLGDRAEAEDMVQEALTKVWLEPSKFAPARARFSTWFYRVVTNRCLDQRRRRRPEGLPENFDAADPAPGAETQLAAADRRRLTAAAIDALPERQRTAVTLCYLHGLSNAEAAQILDMKVKALESLLVRARTKLKQQLAPVRAALMEGEEA